MLPVRTSRRDPAPSRFRYRLTRLWLRPSFRRLVNFAVPMLAGTLLAWTLADRFEARARLQQTAAFVHDAIVDRPQFTITRINVRDVSSDLTEQIKIAAFVDLPANSLEVDVGSVRARIEALAAVDRARVRALPSGILDIRAIERVPVVLWRSERGLELLDGGGVRVAEVDSRLRRADLPLIAGEGAQDMVPEALALLESAGAVAQRIRGLVRVGGRRWDIVLDRNQVIRLPESGPEAALRRVMAIHASDQLLDRDLTVVDMRAPGRPMLRLTGYAIKEIERLRAAVKGEDA